MPHETVAPRNRSFAKAMRQDMTKAELRLWQHLRKPGLRGFASAARADRPLYRRLLLPERKLIVEVDGEQHGFDRVEARDQRRDAWLHDHGYCVLRFTNRDVMTNLNGVCDTVLVIAAERRPE